MRILIASYQTISMPGSGIRRVVLKTAEHLRQKGVEVLMFDQWARYDWDSIDLVHVYATDMRNYFLFRALPQSVPLVVTPIIDSNHAPAAISAFRRVAHFLPRQLLSSYTSHDLAFDAAKTVICCSQTERNLLIKGFDVPGEKIQYVPNGVDRSFAAATPDLFQQRYGIADFVLYVGQIGNPRKNLMRLLATAETMPAQRFVLAGPMLQSLLALRIVERCRELHNVDYIGQLSEQELASAYAACSVLALPSYREATGLVALEAGLAGAQIAITCVGGPPDYFGPHAYYCDPDSPPSIRKAIEAALDHQGDNDLRAYIINNYLWEGIADRLIDIYTSILSTTPESARQ